MQAKNTSTLVTSANRIAAVPVGTTLTRFVSAVFDTGVTTSAEACAWLADGGWPELEAWLAGHRSDRPRRVVTPPSEGR